MSDLIPDPLMIGATLMTDWDLAGFSGCYLIVSTLISSCYKSVSLISSTSEATTSRFLCSAAFVLGGLLAFAIELGCKIYLCIRNDLIFRKSLSFNRILSPLDPKFVSITNKDNL
jgi:hypothetical protein